MKCAKDKLGVKISQSNINMDLSMKMDTGSIQIVDIFLLYCVLRCCFHFIIFLGHSCGMLFSQPDIVPVFENFLIHSMQHPATH